MSTMLRNQFVKLMVGAALLTVAAACSDDGGDAGPDATTTGCTVMIATNHPHGMHMLEVSAADLSAGADKTYDIMGAATHNHMVTITAAQFAELVSKTPVTVTSTDGGGHTHAVTISC